MQPKCMQMHAQKISLCISPRITPARMKPCVNGGQAPLVLSLKLAPILCMLLSYPCIYPVHDSILSMRAAACTAPLHLRCSAAWRSLRDGTPQTRASPSRASRAECTGRRTTAAAAAGGTESGAAATLRRRRQRQRRGSLRWRGSRCCSWW